MVVFTKTKLILLSLLTAGIQADLCRVLWSSESCTESWHLWDWSVSSSAGVHSCQPVSWSYSLYCYSVSRQSSHVHWSWQKCWASALLGMEELVIHISQVDTQIISG